jgi:hypothetical protein
MKHRLESTRICDLGLTLAKSQFAPLIKKLHRELAAKGVRLRPNFYLSNEYGCVERTANIGLLWVDALDQIPALWRRYRDRARDASLLLRILRHEAGHAFGYVHRLYVRRDFRRLFKVRGAFFGSYPDHGWEPTKRHEARFRRGEYINLRAMKHPDEDFAITFQTWLNPEIDWRRQYESFPKVLAKLEWVDAAARGVGRRPAANDRRRLDVPVSELTMTVAEWFR